MNKSKIPLYLSNILYGGALITSPIWGAGSLYGLYLMEDVNPHPISKVCGMTSIFATPFALLYTLGYQRKFGFNKKVALVPIVPLAAIGLCFITYDESSKNNKKNGN